jgi:acyl-CoA thioesterase FadM
MARIHLDLPDQFVFVTGLTVRVSDLNYGTEKFSGREVARAKTGIVCFDYARRKVAPVPEPLMTKLNQPT